MTQEVLTATTSAPLNAGGTVTFNYPTGRTSMSYLRGTEMMSARPNGTILKVSNGDISVSYGATSIVVTYAQGATIPVNTLLLLGLDQSEDITDISKSFIDIGVNVMGFGAKGDRTTDDTAAFLAAINAAKAVKGSVYVPLGWYKLRPMALSGTDIGFAIKGEAWNSNLAESPEFGGVVLELISGSNGTLFTVDPLMAPVHFENLYFRGNQAGQTADTSYCIDFTDSGSPARSGTFYRCRFERWRNGAVRIGSFRDAGQMDQCVFLNNGFDSLGSPVNATGGDGVTMAACNDWRFNRIDSGANSRNGMYLVSAGTVLANNVNCFSNIKRGVQIDGTAQTINFNNGSLDRNLQEGLLIVGSTSTTKCHGRNFTGYVFSGNGNQTTNTYSDIRINNEAQGFTSIINCTFTKGGFANLPKYCVETQGTTQGIVVAEPLLRTDANAPYVTAFTNDTTKLAGGWVTNVDAAVNGYVWYKDHTGTMRKLATIA